MKHVLLILAFSLTACATPRISLRDIKDYDQAIHIAESNGLDTKEMHKHLVEMFVSYLKDPGEDPQLAAMKQAADAQGWQAAALMIQATQPVYQPQPMPMSPREFNHAVWGR